MRFYRGLPVAIGLLFIIGSCRENEDLSSPVIEFLEPSEHLTIDLPDTLKVVADVHDDRHLESVMVVMVDGEGKPVTDAVYKYPDQKEYQLSAYILADDKSINSGTYRILVTAFDGSNTKNEYRELFLNEIPLQLLGYIALTASYPFETSVVKYDTAFQPDTSFMIQKGYLNSGINHLWEQFYFVSSEPSVIYSFDLRQFEMLWEFPANLPRPEFSGIFIDSELLFATMNADAGILNEKGKVILRTEAWPDRVIESFTADDEYLYAELVTLSGNQREIAAYYRSTGMIRSQKIIYDDIVSLLPFKGKALMISDEAVNVVLSEFDPENMWITRLTTLEPQHVSSSLAISEDELLIFSDEGVLIYDYYLNLISPFLPAAYRFGRYDRLNDRLFMVSDSAVDVYQLPGLALIQSLGFEEPVMDFHIIYNK